MNGSIHRRRSTHGVARMIGPLVIAFAIATMAGSATAAKTERDSESSSGAQANRRSGEPAISKNGRFVAFNSSSDNIVPGDVNGLHDCFVRDHATKQTEITSVHSSGALSDRECWGSSISANGRFVAFESNATNLVDGDTNSEWDVFLRDRATGTTELVSIAANGSLGNRHSLDPSVSPNGRYVVFQSEASNLVDGDTNGTWDVFVRDRWGGLTYRVSVGSDGAQGNKASRDPSISSGRYVVYQSFADNLVKGDTNRTADIFVYDQNARTTRRVNVASAGRQAKGGSSFNPGVSSDGRFIVFDSTAKNLVRGDTNRQSDVFVRDMKARSTERVSVGSGGRQASGASKDPTISANGRRVAFHSDASNLVAGDSNRVSDAFVRDRVNKRTMRVSVRSNGKQSQGGSSQDAALSGDGKFVAFESSARNLVRNDTNGVEDVYRYGPIR